VLGDTRGSTRRLIRDGAGKRVSVFRFSNRLVYAIKPSPETLASLVVRQSHNSTQSVLRRAHVLGRVDASRLRAEMQRVADLMQKGD